MAAIGLWSCTGRRGCKLTGLGLCLRRYSAAANWWIRRSAIDVVPAELGVVDEETKLATRCLI